MLLTMGNEEPELFRVKMIGARCPSHFI